MDWWSDSHRFSSLITKLEKNHILKMGKTHVSQWVMPGWTFTSGGSGGSRTEIQIKPFQASQHMAQQHLCAVFCFLWDMHDHQFTLMFLIMTFLKLQHPCRSYWVFGLQKKNSQNINYLGSTFPCLPRDQLCFGDVTAQSAQISVFPQFSQIFILF